MFTYYNHNRLTHEVRTPGQGASPQNPAYDLAYTYDAGGNRLTKFDALNNVTTVYHYDVEDQEAYGTRNNRLMWYAVSQNGQEVEKVYYAYHAGGHADQIIRKAAGDATYYRTYFLYDKQGRTWMAVNDQWQLDGQTGAPVNAERTAAREFRYAGARSAQIRAAQRQQARSAGEMRERMVFSCLCVQSLSARWALTARSKRSFQA